MRWSRLLTILAAGLIGFLCSACLAFSFYIGHRYLSHVERLDNRAELQLVLAIKSTETPYVGADRKDNLEIEKRHSDQTVSSFRISEYVAPLLPGLFSSLFAVISIITLARFVSTYGKEEADQKPEYGAIKTLISEVAELIKSFKGSKD